MTAQQIISKFEKMVGDSLDRDFTLELVNDAMHEVEEDVSPEGLKAVDASESTAVGQTYTTGIPLPDDFYLPEPVIYVGSSPYTQVPFERAADYRDSSGYFYIDHANGTYHLGGRQTSVQTITFPYRYTTAELVLEPEPTSPAWPSQFHRLIPLKMAALYYAIDAGEKARTWDDRWMLQYERGLNRFKDYDARLKLAGMDHSTAPIQARGDGELQINLD